MPEPSSKCKAGLAPVDSHRHFVGRASFLCPTRLDRDFFVGRAPFLRPTFLMLEMPGVSMLCLDASLLECRCRAQGRCPTFRMVPMSGIRAVPRYRGTIDEAKSNLSEQTPCCLH